jgi:DNA-binding XRE family transcriptional regulator
MAVSTTEIQIEALTQLSLLPGLNMVAQQPSESPSSQMTVRDTVVAEGDGGCGGLIMALILGVQCFLAREALGWTMSHLAHVAEVSRQSVARFERGGAVKTRTLEAIQRTLEEAGVFFIDANDGGPGAGLRK